MSTLFKNILSRNVLKTAASLKTSSFDSLKSASRSIWHVSNSESKFHHPTNVSLTGGCKCGVACIHSNGGPLFTPSSEMTGASSTHYDTEKELSAFLIEEIAAEKKLQKVKSIPSEVDGFQVKQDGSEVTLTKKVGQETIEVMFNINHSVDTESEPEVDVTARGDVGEMKSRPNFEVEIKRGDQTLGFTCSMVPPSAAAETSEDVYNDLFTIDEVVFYNGEWKDTNYSVAGDVLDGTLYDMFMDLLEDKGVSNEFIEKVSNFSTAYEHSQYISMLEQVQKFCSSSK